VEIYKSFQLLSHLFDKRCVQIKAGIQSQGPQAPTRLLFD